MNTSLSGVCAMSILAVLSAANCGQADTDLPPASSAKGSLTYDGGTAELKFAAAFVDQKDERKPIVLLISDQRLPVEKWESEFDMMMDHSKWSGVVFFLDKEGKFFRSEVHMKGLQWSVSGIFELTIDDPSSKDLTGTAKTIAGEKETKLHAAFHAIVSTGVSAFNFGGRLVSRAPSDWITFSPPTADFTVSAPAPLIDTTQTIQSSAGPVQRHRYHANWRGSYFAIERWDCPADFHIADSTRAFDAARDSTLGGAHGRLLDESAVVLGRLTGRQQRISVDGGQLISIMRIYLVGNRFYQGIFVRPSSGRDEDGLRFLDSLHISGE